jgi:hypothetical protein
VWSELENASGRRNVLDVCCYIHRPDKVASGMQKVGFNVASV